MPLFFIISPNCSLLPPRPLKPSFCSYQGISFTALAAFLGTCPSVSICDSQSQTLELDICSSQNKCNLLLVYTLLRGSSHRRLEIQFTNNGVIPILSLSFAFSLLRNNINSQFPPRVSSVSKFNRFETWLRRVYKQSRNK